MMFGQDAARLATCVLQRVSRERRVLSHLPQTIGELGAHGRLQCPILRHAPRPERSALDAPRHTIAPLEDGFLVEDVIGHGTVAPEAESIELAEQTRSSGVSCH